MSSTIRTAFTLIELLVAISIIALLIAILLPSLSAARDVAKASVCLSNLRQQAILNAAYLADNDNYYYPYYFDADPIYNAKFWPARLIVNGYIDDLRMWECPGYDSDYKPFLNAPTDVAPADIASVGTSIAWIHYGYNYQYLGSATGLSPRPANYTYRSAVQDMIAKPSQTIAHMDSRRGVAAYERGYCFVTDTEGANTYLGHGRHNSAVNVLWADGHAAATRVEDPFDVMPELPGRWRAPLENVWDRD